MHGAGFGLLDRLQHPSANGGRGLIKIEHFQTKPPINSNRGQYLDGGIRKAAPFSAASSHTARWESGGDLTGLGITPATQKGPPLFPNGASHKDLRWKGASTAWSNGTNQKIRTGGCYRSVLMFDSVNFAVYPCRSGDAFCPLSIQCPHLYAVWRKHRAGSLDRLVLPSPDQHFFESGPKRSPSLKPTAIFLRQSHV